MLKLEHLAAGIEGRIRATSLARRIVVLTAILLAAVYASSAFVLTRYYTALSERARDSREAKAQLLAEHAGRALAAVDLSLATIAEALKASLPLKPTVFTQLLLDRYIRSLPQVRALAVADADGRTVNNSRRFPPPKISTADRPFFAEQKKWRGLGLYFDRIETSRIDHKPFFAISRPVLDDDGNFRGIVAAITDPQYFANFYGPQAGQMNESVLLERDDGAVLASAGVPYAALAGFARRPLRARDRRRMAVSEVHGFPAKVVLIGGPVTAMPQFRTFVGMDLGLLVTMTAMGVYLAAAAARKAAALDRETQARRIAEARLLRAIESAPAGFVLYDRNDRLVLANDLYRSLRKAIDEMTGSGREASRSPVQRQPAAEDEPVLQLPDGRWLMARQRRTKEGDVVVFYSDITALKQHQQQLDRLTEVQRLFVDALEHIPSGLMLCDAGDRIVFCNSATRQYFPNVAALLAPGTPFETLLRAQVASGYLPAAAADPERCIAPAPPMPCAPMPTGDGRRSSNVAPPAAARSASAPTSPRSNAKRRRCVSARRPNGPPAGPPKRPIRPRTPFSPA
jgi:PAS domain-containing protein